MNIRIGITPYLNAFPFYTGLVSELRNFQVDFVEGSPSVLNELIRNGKVYLSLISSLEYIKSSDQYLVLPNLSISSREHSQSVGLVWRGKIQELKGQEIFFSRESFTSVALLDVLLKERFEIKDATLSPANGSMDENSPSLVIGDQALHIREQLNGSAHFYDLGTLWWEWMKKPFCFALWVVRRDFYQKNREAVNQIAEILRKRVAVNLSEIPVHLKEYLLNFDYSLSPDILQGLFLFYERAAKLGWVNRIKDVEFIL